MMTLHCYATGYWETDYNVALTQASKERKLLLLDFTGSDWCSWCLKLSKETFSQPAFMAYAERNLILLEVDFPRHKSLDPAIEQQNKELAKKFEIKAFPTLILLNSKGEEIARNRGFLAGGTGGFIKWVGMSVEH